MEKMLSVLMAVLLLISFLLASCAPADLPGEEQGDSQGEGDPEKPAEEITFPPLDMALTYGTVLYPAAVYNNVFYGMVKQTNGTGRMLFYYEFETGESGFLCGKPDCMHNTQDCNAFFVSAEGLGAYDGKLYVMWHDEVYRLNPDGTGRERIKDLTVRNSVTGKLEGTLLPYGSSEFHLHHGRIYYVNRNKVIVDGVPKYRINLISMSTAADLELKTLFHKDYENSNPTIKFLACNNGFYFTVSSTESEGKRTEILRFRDGSDEPEIVLNTVTESILLGTLYIDKDDNLYTRGKQTNYAVCLVSGGELIEKVTAEEGDKRYTSLCIPYQDKYVMVKGGAGEKEILIKTMDNKTVYQGPLPVESLKALGVDTSALGGAYLGYAGNRFYIDLQVTKEKMNYYMAYELTESGLKETLMFVHKT